MKRVFIVNYSENEIIENNNIKWLDESVCKDFLNVTSIYPIEYVDVETIEDDEEVGCYDNCRVYTLPMDLYSEEYLNNLEDEELEQWMQDNEQYLTYSSCENDNELYSLFMAFYTVYDEDLYDEGSLDLEYKEKAGKRVFAFVCNRRDSFDCYNSYAENTVEYLGLDVDWDDLSLYEVCFGSEDEEMKYDNYLKFNRVDKDNQIYYEDGDERVYLIDDNGEKEEFSSYR